MERKLAHKAGPVLDANGKELAALAVDVYVFDPVKCSMFVSVGGVKPVVGGAIPLELMRVITKRLDKAK